MNILDDMEVSVLQSNDYSIRCKEGKMKERKHALNEKRIVGVTCASTRQDILSSQEFPILILDESSQVC